MKNDPAIEYEGAIDTLLIALATQAGETNDARFSEGALECLVDQGRAGIRRLLGCLGHIVHYGAGTETEWLRALFEQFIAALRRAKDRGADELLPGDLVEMVVARPQDQLKAGTVMRVYCVGEDGTADLGFESLVDDYVIFTVELGEIQLRFNGDRIARSRLE
jgi:hypothetical protein